MSEPQGLSQRELLDLFDRCEAHPTIRAAIRGVLRLDAAVRERDELRDAATELADAADNYLNHDRSPNTWATDLSRLYVATTALRAALDSEAEA